MNGVYPHLRRSERDSNLDLPIIGSLAYSKSSALDHVPHWYASGLDLKRIYSGLPVGERLYNGAFVSHRPNPLNDHWLSRVFRLKTKSTAKQHHTNSLDSSNTSKPKSTAKQQLTVEKPPPVHPTEIRTSISPSISSRAQHDKRVSQLRHRDYNYSSPMASLVLSDSSQLTSGGFEKLPDQIMYLYAEQYDLQKHHSHVTWEGIVWPASITQRFLPHHGVFMCRGLRPSGYHCAARVAELPREMSLRYKRRGNNSDFIDRDGVIRWRHKYSKDIKKFRAEGRPIIYTDESWVNVGHSVSMECKDTTIQSSWQAFLEGLNTGLKPPRARGPRFAMVHAGNGNDFVEGADIVFLCEKNTADSHDYMDGDINERLFSEQLLPDTPEGAVIVIDNSAYHSGSTTAIQLYIKASPHVAMLRRSRPVRELPSCAQQMRSDCPDIKEAGRDREGPAATSGRLTLSSLDQVSGFTNPLILRIKAPFDRPRNVPHTTQSLVPAVGHPNIYKLVDVSFDVQTETYVKYRSKGLRTTKTVLKKK
uniref:(California timema) hypothetical protein n=1 Tax=Timema californicum TaxID=61474 RepID=A0A7R9IXP6_TIMCA|nr:unnamed protein product [Timema californicum]